MSELKKNNHYTIERKGRFLIVSLNQKHLVYSSSIINGGHQEALKFLVNHQSCEGAKHIDRAHILTDCGHEEYHRQTCSEAGTEPNLTAMMGTAADMQYVAIDEQTYKDISACAIVTAGVTGNACRAGEETLWHEVDSGWEKCYEGTINIIVLINVPLLPATLCQAITTITEAKSAALLDLAIPSKKGRGLATGTGTDQFCVASIIDDQLKPKSGAGKHVKLGEIIAKAVINATKKAMQFQNGLEPSLTRSFHHALGRFGLTEDYFKEQSKNFLSENDYDLLLNNMKSVVYSPGLSSACYALASILDRIDNGVYPPEMMQDNVVNQCALIATTLSTKDSYFQKFKNDIHQKSETLQKMETVVFSICLGWSHKWNSP